MVIPDSVTKGNPNDKLVIFGFAAIGGTTGSSSSYVSKVETFCRLAEIPYEVELANGTGASPKQTMPFIKHGDVVLADSEFIIEYLTNTYDVKVKRSADPKLRGMAVAVKRLCDHHIYGGAVYYRWVNPQGWAVVRDQFFGQLPVPLKWIVPNAVRKHIISSLYKQGFARHSEPDLRKLLDASLCAISDILGENKYITGEEPCPEDAAVFGVLDNCLKPEMEGVPLANLVKKYPNLVVYVENMKSTYFPEDNPSKFAEKS